jgi:hypothetical protein
VPGPDDHDQGPTGHVYRVGGPGAVSGASADPVARSAFLTAGSVNTAAPQRAARPSRTEDNQSTTKTRPAPRPVDDVVDTPRRAPDNPVEPHVDVELSDGGGDLREVPGERAVLAGLQCDGVLAPEGDAATELVAELLARVAAADSSRSQLCKHLAADPGALTRGGSRMSKVAGEFLYAVDAGVAGIVAPSCALCSRPRTLFHTHGDGERICTDLHGLPESQRDEALAGADMAARQNILT